MKRTLCTVCTLLVLTFTAACAHVPPNASPAATVAFYQTQVVKAADLVRDFAVASNATVPPVLSTATTAAIVKWHDAALTIIAAAPAGWQQVVITSLNTVVNDLPSADQKIIGPYVPLVVALLQSAS